MSKAPMCGPHKIEYELIYTPDESQHMIGCTVPQCEQKYWVKMEVPEKCEHCGSPMFRIIELDCNWGEGAQYEMWECENCTAGAVYVYHEPVEDDGVEDYDYGLGQEH